MVICIDSLSGARERALTLCGEAASFSYSTKVSRYGRFGLAWKGEGLRLRRVYCFGFSEEGDKRRPGYVVLHGRCLEELSFGLPSRTRNL